MRIVMFSITPLFPDLVMGGAQKHIQSIALYLGRLGHEVTVLCTRRDEGHGSFQWSERVKIRPILRFRQPFPGPYAVPAYDLASIVQEMAEHLSRADRFYLHDGEFLFPYVYRHIPTVVSLRDNVYPETIHGSFLFDGDALILISEYSRRYYASTAGRFLPGLTDRMKVIPNGFDWEHFAPTSAKEIVKLLPVDPARHAIVLHPHRPEGNKGLPETIEVADRLVHRHGITNLRVLVPRWIESAVGAEVDAFYREMTREIAARGLADHIVFHEWIPQRLMPQYYSRGAVTLSLGSFAEAFGNAVYESLGCGTPSIAARVAAHREILPDELLDKVDYGDHDAAAELAAAIIRSGRRASPETLAYLHKHYGYRRMLEGYAETILSAGLTPKLEYRPPQPIGAQTTFRLAPWCYPSERGIFHDFRADYLTGSGLDGLAARYPDGFKLAIAQAAGVDEETVIGWYREGFLIPVN